MIEHQLRGRDLHAPAWLRWLIVFNVVMFGWILFRAGTLELAGRVRPGQLAVPGPGDAVRRPRCVAAVIGVIGFQLLPPAPLERVRLWFAQLPAPALGAGLAAVIAVVGATVPGGASHRSSTSSSDARAHDPVPTRPPAAACPRATR